MSIIKLPLVDHNDPDSVAFAEERIALIKEILVHGPIDDDNAAKLLNSIVDICNESVWLLKR